MTNGHYFASLTTEANIRTAKNEPVTQGEATVRPPSRA